MHDNTSLFNTQTRGELIEKRIYNMGWGETSPEGLAHKEIKEASQKLSSSKCCLRDLYTFPEESDEDETHEEQLIILTQETQKLAISQFDHEQAVLSQKTIPQSPIHSMETRSTDTSQHSEATKPNIFLNKYGDKFFNCILGSQTNKKVSPPTSQALFGDNEQSQNITYFNKIYRLTQNDKKLNKTKPNNLDSQVPRNMNSRRIKKTPISSQTPKKRSQGSTNEDIPFDDIEEVDKKKVKVDSKQVIKESNTEMKIEKNSKSSYNQLESGLSNSHFMLSETQRRKKTTLFGN